MGHSQDGEEGEGEGEGVKLAYLRIRVKLDADYTHRKGIYPTSTTAIYVLLESLILFANPKFI